jgi:hypothetical protein
MAKTTKQEQSEIISELYQLEAGEALEDIETIQVSIPLRSEYKFMLEAIADRFRVPMARIAGPILQDGLFLAFSTLSEKDQDKAASVADQKNHDFLVKQFNGGYEQHGMRYWAMQAYCLRVGNEKNEKSEAA